MKRTRTSSVRLSKAKYIIFALLSILLPFIGLEVGLRIFRTLTKPADFSMSLRGSSAKNANSQIRPRQIMVENLKDPSERYSGPFLIPDPVLHHVWCPYLYYVNKDRVLITNRQGWVEDYDVSVVKPANTYRIFYVGDSSVQGMVVPEYKMVEIVKKRLNERFGNSGIHFEVINTGTSSYSILTYYLLVKTDLPMYMPDLVVLNIDMTDVVQDYVYRQWIVKNNSVDISGIANNDDVTPYIMTPQGIVRGHKRSRIFMWLVRHCATAYYLDRALLLQEAKRVALSGEKGDETANWLALKWTDSIRENVNLSMQTLASTIKLLKTNGVKVMVTGVPHLPQYEGRWSVKPFEMLENVAKENGVPYLDTYEGMRKKANGGKLSEFYRENDPTHFNIKGNEAWSEIQLDFLTDKNNNLLPFDRLAAKTPASR